MKRQFLIGFYKNVMYTTLEMLYLISDLTAKSFLIIKMSFFKGHLEIVKQTFSNEEGIDRNLFYKNIRLIFLL